MVRTIGGRGTVCMTAPNRVHHDGLSLGVADHVRELWGRMRDGERNGDAAGPPDPHSVTT